MDIMVHLETYQIDLISKVYKYSFLILFCTFFSCSNEAELEVLASDKNLNLQNGILSYNDSPFRGTIVSYHEAGNLKYSAEYLDGQKHGQERKWYSNESLAEERFYTNGRKSGIHIAFWPNGNKKFVYHFNTIGEYNGNVKEWFKTGELMRDFNYISGKESGSQRMWNVDKSIRANYEVVNGERFGLIGLKKCYQVTVGSNEIK